MSDAEFKERGRRLWKPLVGVALVAVGVWWVVAHGDAPVAAEPRPIGMAVPPGAETVTAAEVAVAPPLDIIGTVASGEMVHLAARLNAYVRQVHVTAGQRVSQGELLIELDDRDLQEQALAAAAQLTQAEAEYNRTRQLFEKQASTEQALTSAEASFRAARAQAERVRVMLSDTRIVAPIAGTVTDRRVEAGDLASPGQVLLAMYDPTNMRLEAPVPLRLIARLALEGLVEVALERPDAAVTGRVVQIVSQVDPQSRTQLVKVQLPAGMEGILPGTFGRMWVPDDERPVVLIPASAVYRVGQLELVQVVLGDRVVRRAVKTGLVLGDQVEIAAGLAPGDVVLRAPVAGAGV